MNILSGLSKMLGPERFFPGGGRSSSTAPFREQAPLVSVVIPAYKESARIGYTLTRITEFMPVHFPNYQVIVVDDGNPKEDPTRAVVKTFISDNPRHDITFLEHWPNRGKGFSVREGALEARGNYILFMDADSSTDISELKDFMPHFDDGADIVIGSRQLEGSNLEVRQPPYREMMGRTFNYFVRWIVGLQGIKDTQCGFKAFSASSTRRLFERQKMDRFSFDVELLYMARKAGLRIDQQPITWRDSPRSTVHPVWDSANMFMDLIRIRWMHRGDQ